MILIIKIFVYEVVFKPGVIVLSFFIFYKHCPSPTEGLYNINHIILQGYRCTDKDSTSVTVSSMGRGGKFTARDKATIFIG